MEKISGKLVLFFIGLVSGILCLVIFDTIKELIYLCNKKRKKDAFRQMINELYIEEYDDKK